MSLKRVLSRMLCLCTVLLCAAALDIIPEAKAAAYELTIEAEDTAYAVWNKYASTNTDHASYSGGTGVGGASGTPVYASWDDADSTEDFAGGFLDKGNDPYVAFYVDAAEAGTYYLTTGSYFRTNGVPEGGLYAAFLVNPSRKTADPDATVAYKGYYNNPDALYEKVYLTTDAVAVELEKGRNVIYMTPLTNEQSVRWANADFIKITGDHELVPVEANKQTLYAGNAPYIYSYTTHNVDGSVGDGGWSAAGKLIGIADMSTENVTDLRSFTYTVNAPADGYYDITAAFDSAKTGADAYALGFLVDGKPQAREFAFTGGSYNTKGYVDFSVYLSAGDHVLTFTAPAKRVSSDTYTPDAWFNYNELFLYGGLTQSVIQSNPAMEWWYAEAENTVYANAHLFAKTQTNSAESIRDFNGTNYISAVYPTGCGTHASHSTMTGNDGAGLREGRLNKTVNGGVTIYVDAAEAGDYQFKARIQLANPGIWDSTNSVWTKTPETYFMVNGDYQKTAGFLGAEGSTDWDDTETVSLTLKKGINEITFIPMLAENRIDGNDWVNVDCIFVDTGLQVAKVPTESVSYVPAQGTAYLYPTTKAADDATLPSGVGGSMYREAELDGVNATDITRADLHKLSFVSYTVDAPYDGYYDILLKFNSHTTNTAEDFAFALLVDEGTRAEIKHIVSCTGDTNQQADISTYLTKGTHTLTVPIVLPIDADSAAANAIAWCDQGQITLCGGLTLAETQIHPLFEGMSVLEAEADASRNFYNEEKALQSHTLASGGGYVGYALGGRQTTDALMTYMEPSSGQAYVEYVVDAPADGSYGLGIGLYGSFSDGSRYVLLQVNGVMQEQSFDGSNSAFYYQPATVELKAGRNIIRVLSTTASQSGCWVNYDYLAVPDGVTCVAPADYVRTEADRTAFKGNYNNRSDGAEEDRLDNCVVSEVAAGGLSEDTFRKTSWYALTVEAPADGYYSVQSYVLIPAVDTAAVGKIGMLVDGQPRTVSLIQNNLDLKNNAGSNYIAAAEAFVYLTKGTHDVIITGILADSGISADGNGVYWMDADYICLGGGLTVAQTQRYPVEGLVDGSVLAIADGKVANIWKSTTVGALKSNFFGEVTVTSGGSVLSDDATVPNGAVVSYASGTEFAVETYDRGDANGDGVIDVRDLKIANEQALCGTLTNLIADIIRTYIVDNEDVEAYKRVIFGALDSELFYQPGSIGAEQIMTLCDPVGRLVSCRSAVFMESSASNFTISGDLKGDVKLALRAEMGKSDGTLACIYVEVDGVVSQYPFAVNTDQVITIASGLTAGEHTIKVSKGTEAKYDSIYVYSVAYNGTLRQTAAAAHSIEYLGDSITVGYGLYEADTTRKNTMSGSYYSYANVAADLLGANHYTIGNSGWRFGTSTNSSTGNANNYLGYIYEKLSMNQALGAYDFGWQPEVVVINLGTNDAIQYSPTGDSAADQQLFTTQIATLLDLVRKNNPNAAIFWVYGAMEGASDIQCTDAAEWIQNAITAYNTDKTDAMKVTYVGVTADISGVYSHPTRAGQALIGQEVAKAIASRMGWEITN